ncbi:MAG: VCBS repeat-containing protein [Myxococcales bacterium]|nr:VCBS repeat-containing protein [Myxococcales bacterium]
MIPRARVPLNRLRLQLEITVDGVTKSPQAKRAAAGASDSIAIEFPSGYPRGQRVTIDVTALDGPITVGSGHGATTLDAGCKALAIDLAASADGGADLAPVKPVAKLSFATKVDYPVGAEPWHLVTGDFNNDSRLDIVAANVLSNRVSMLLGKGDGTFQAAVNWPSGPATFVAAADLNGDGKLDLVVNAKPRSRLS